MNQTKGPRRLGGIPAKRLVVPIIALLVVLHAVIISVIFMINQTSSSLSAIMQDQGRYTQEATGLLGGSSLLSETCTTFVLMPVSESGELTVGPLVAYATELGETGHRGDAVMASFRTYDVPAEALAQLQTAADSANFLLDAQLHALALMKQAYPFPPVPQLAAIPDYPLTEEERALTGDAAHAAARQLVMNTVYSENKGMVSANVNGCVGAMQAALAQRASMTAQRVAKLRVLLWAVTLTIIFTLALTFITLYSQVLRPLGGFVKLIPINRFLDEQKGIREVRMVASAYNDVLKRRDALDQILRSAAETDALTNLPNRYRFEQYVLESGESGYSMAVLLFDVNYLKKTNDTEGHLAGDKLIRSAAECISSCFGEDCFRFGGDEFAAVVKNCTPETIHEMVKRFEEAEKEYNVSISMGYAYAPEIGDTTFRKLLDEADKHMYAQKKAIHQAG